MTSRLEFAMDVVTMAGKLTLERFGKRLAFESKGKLDPVTEVDREVEQFLRAQIAKHYPGEAILGEEFGGNASQNQWVIDPIDGTKSYLCGVPLYANLLSYEEAGVATVAVCNLPALDELYSAETGKGAFCNGEKCNVSEVDKLDQAVIGCASITGFMKTGMLDGFTELAPQVLATRTWCDAYGHMMVASGRIEAMIDPVLQKWDVSAVDLIVREAGGICTDVTGKASARTNAISANPSLHQKIVEYFHA